MPAPTLPFHLPLLALLLLGTACHRDAAHAMTPTFQNAQLSALAEAVAQGDADAVRAQVAQGASPDGRAADGLNLLQYAMLAQNKRGFDALLAAGANPNTPGLGGSTAMHGAAIADDPYYLEQLLAHRGDPNVRHAENGQTPLAQAVGPRTDAQFQLLLKAGANPDAADNMQYTPLHRAAMINAGAHVLQLLDAGASAVARSAQDVTFQRYYFNVPADNLNDKARAERAKVVEWLRAHDVPLEAGAGG